MGKGLKYFLISLSAALAALGIYHFIRAKKLEQDALAEGEAYTDEEPCGCCGAEFTEEQKKDPANELPKDKAQEI